MRQIPCSILIVSLSLSLSLSLLVITQSATIQAPTKPLKSLHDHFPSKNITNLQEIKTLPGFKALKVIREAGSGVIRIEKIPELLRFWLSSLSLSQAQ